jgi:hypothetical protein
MRNYLGVLACLSVAWGVISSINIALFLAKRGTKINFLFFRVLVLKYIHEYYKITKEENGKPGPWFYSYILSMNLALVFAVIGVLLK